MPQRLERARVFRSRAEELRIVAHDWPDDDPKQKMAGIANDYDRMAEQLEQAAKADGISAR